MRQPQELPPLPAAHARAIEMLARHDAEPGEMTEVVEGDPSLTTAVLRAANSASSAPRQPLRTALDAVIRIGLGPTRRIIAGAALRRNFDGLDGSGLVADDLWQHLLATALLADALAWTNGPRTQAFTAGLLHDLGRMAMACAEPARYADVLRYIRDGAEPMEAERRVFGVDHAAWGADLAARWGLPEEIATVIGSHHEGDGSPLAWVTWQGRELAGRLGIGDGITPGGSSAADLGPDDEAVLATFGGYDGLLRRVAWYRGALGQSAAA